MAKTKVQKLETKVEKLKDKIEELETKIILEGSFKNGERFGLRHGYERAIKDIKHYLVEHDVDWDAPTYGEEHAMSDVLKLIINNFKQYLEIEDNIERDEVMIEDYKKPDKSAWIFGLYENIKNGKSSNS